MMKAMKQAATQAGSILLHYYKKNLTLSYKTSYKDFYTIADIESQKIIQKIITKLLVKKGIDKSEIGFIGEENLNVAANKKHLFVIDPLDGTTNFASGFDFFSISIGYFYEGSLTAGLIYRPTTKDFYYGQKNKGAYKNNQVLRIVKKPLKECLFDGAVSSRPDKYSDLFKSFENIFPHVSGFRSIFSMALSICLLAENVFNIVINGHTFIWDISCSKTDY